MIGFTCSRYKGDDDQVSKKAFRFPESKDLSESPIYGILEILNVGGLVKFYN